MLTQLQIYAIMALLTAFGVSQPTINNVQGILEGNQTTQSAPLVQTQSVPDVVGSFAPQCDETLALTSNKGERSRGSGFNGAVEKYTYHIGVINTCNKDFSVDYQGYSWDGPNNALIAVPEAYKIQGSRFQPYYLLDELNPVPGTYTVTLIAHATDGTATSSPLTIMYTSHGVLTDQEFYNLGQN